MQLIYIMATTVENGHLLKIFIALLALNTSLGQNLGFLSQPQDAIVAPDSPHQVSCTANTTLVGTLHILWKRNNTWITDFTNKHYRQLSNGSLLFERFLHADQGSYQCSALVLSPSNIHLGQIYSRVATVRIAYIENTFRLHPESRSGLLGSTVQLQCLSPKSEPTAKVYWEKNGIRIYGFRNASLELSSEKILSATLMIQNLSNSNAGMYKCVAYNVYLKNKEVKSNAASVSISAAQELPYFEKKPTSTVVSRFQSFTWECLIRGVPQPTILWYHNSQLVANDTDRFMMTTGSLHFASMQEKYNGSYVCEGRNSLGSTRLNPPVALVVAYIDFDFATNPSSTNITSGSTLLLRCSPPHRYPLAVTISWYLNFVQLSPNGNVSILADGSLRIIGITRANEGVYFCQALHTSTKIARTSKRATVTVRVLPRIETVLSNTSALVGESLRRICTAQGYPTPIVKWYKDGAVQSNDAILLLSRISLTDAGFYTCRAVNVAGNDSIRFFLHVSTTPAVLVAPSNQTKIVGQTVQFKCEFYGTPKPSVVWYFIAAGSPSRQLITFGSRIITITDGIQISSIRKSDEGKYICQGRSTGGTLDAFATLRVYVPPSFHTAPLNMTTSVSSDVTFQYSTTGDPSPTISWFFNGSSLSPGPKYEISTTYFTVKGATLSDSGRYTVRLSNVAGQHESVVFLDVQVGPVITRFSVPARVRFGQNFSLLCDGAGNPIPSIRWRRNHTSSLQIDGAKVFGNVNNIKIINAKPEDGGVYECILNNTLGQSQRQGTLVVQVLPYPPKNLNAIAVSSTSVRISWTQGFDGYSSTLGYILEFSEKVSSLWNIYDRNISGHLSGQMVAGLKPYTMYRFKMKTFTAIGTSGYSNTVEFQTLEGAPSVPLNLRVQIINATVANVKWDSPAQPNGNITIYQLQYGILNNVDVKMALIAADKLSTLEAILPDLHPFSTYHFKIRAATGTPANRKWGNFSDSLQFATRESAPSAAPSITNLTALSSTSIRISFAPLPRTVLNGILTGYDVRVSAPSHTIAARTNDTSLIISSLHKYTSYAVNVRACTRVGCGPRSTLKHITTLEDVPGMVRNATVAILSSSSIRISWSEPIEKNGVISGYIINIKSNLTGTSENIPLPGNSLTFIKDGLTNTTYNITIAARTRIGAGQMTPPIVIKLSVGGTKTTIVPTPISSATTIAVRSTTIAIKPTPTSTPVRTTSPPPVISKQSIDWLNENNLPILIGVSVAIFILLVVVIILASRMCAHRLTAGTVKRERWLSARTNSGAENPAYIENGAVELRKKPATESQKSDQISTSNAEEFADTKAIDDDFLFEHDSESQIDDVNPSNEYAYDDTMRIKEKDDKSPLMMLRNSEVYLSDDASDYDQPYSQLDELGAPIKDLFSFIDEEEGNLQDNPNAEQPEEHYLDHDHNVDTSDVPRTKSAASPDLTWDNYDTSKAASHDPDEVVYDTPIENPEDPGQEVPEYATVQKVKRDNGQSDKLTLIHNEEEPDEDTLII